MDTRDSPILDKTEVDKGRFFVGKKVIAVAIVIILIASAIAMVLPALIKPDVQQGTQIPSSIKANNGQREVTYVVEDMFHMYLPDFDWNRSGGITFEDVNRHQDVDGMPGWFYLRDPGYGEKILRNTYPHIFYYGPYSTMTAPDVDVGYSIWAPYRMRIMAQNVTDCHTRTGDSTTNNVYFVPDLDGNAGRPNTGWINLSYYGTYMTTNSMNAAYDLGNT
ncbi:MAG: hypothetical protein OEV21_04835, partial [Thermoplasmata archaeon]|nr:hypothetical protein [Thermoplasmata archaeon]